MSFETGDGKCDACGVDIDNLLCIDDLGDFCTDCSNKLEEGTLGTQRHLFVVAVGGQEFQSTLNYMADKGWALHSWDTEHIADENGMRTKSGKGTCWTIYRCVFVRGTSAGGAEAPPEPGPGGAT